VQQQGILKTLINDRIRIELCKNYQWKENEESYVEGSAERYCHFYCFITFKAKSLFKQASHLQFIHKKAEIGDSGVINVSTSPFLSPYLCHGSTCKLASYMQLAISSSLDFLFSKHLQK